MKKMYVLCLLAPFLFLICGCSYSVNLGLEQVIGVQLKAWQPEEIVQEVEVEQVENLLNELGALTFQSYLSELKITMDPEIDISLADGRSLRIMFYQILEYNSSGEQTKRIKKQCDRQQFYAIIEKYGGIELRK